MKINLNYGIRAREKAQGIVEFALVFPLVLMLAYGIIEAGRMLFIYSSVITSSREAARYGAAAGDIGGYVMRYQDCNGIREAAKRLGRFAGIQDANITITYDHGPGSGTNFASCPLTADDIVNLGDRVIVQVDGTYQPMLPLVKFPSFPITGVTRRTIIKDVHVEGTPPSPVTPTVSFVISDQNQSEAAGPMRATLQLSAATDNAVIVPYSIEGTAQEGIDYTISPNQVVFGPGDTLAEIVIDVIDDEMDEDNEAVVLTIGSPQHAIKGSPDVHLALILDDDNPPTISFLLAEQSNPEDIDSVAVLKLSAASSREITVNFDVAGTAEGSGLDYGISASPVVIPVGTGSYPIVIDVTDETMDEEDETIILTLGDVVNATKVHPAQHQYTIIDNDDPPLVSFTWEDQNIDESVGNVAVEIQLSEPSAKTISVPFNLSGSATKNSDYEMEFAIYMFQPGDLTQSITVHILEDGDSEEGDETIAINLLTPVNATKTSPSTHTILITDEAVIPEVFFTSAGQIRDESTGTATTVVTLSSAPSQDVTVHFSFGGTSANGTDYTGTASPVVIPAGGSEAQIEITMIDDAIDEYDETIELTLNTVDNATKGAPDIHTITITDDDDEPVVQFASSVQSVPESSGSVPISLVLSVITGKDVTVPFSMNGSAELGVGKDYTIINTPLTIPAGSPSADIIVDINDDTFIENSEDVIITLGSPTNATLGIPPDHTLTILDNEPICPTPDSLPTFGSSADKNKLVWTLQSPNPLVVVSLTAVSISWPTGSEAQVTAITFGDPIYIGSANPPFLSVTTPVPLWSGAFPTRQMIFKFDKSPKSVSGDFYLVTATFQGCPPISGVVPSD